MAGGPTCPRPWFRILPQPDEGGTGGGGPGGVHQLTLSPLSSFPTSTLCGKLSKSNCTVAGFPEGGEFDKIQMSTSS